MKTKLIVLLAALFGSAFGQQVITPAQVIQWFETKPLGNPPPNQIYMYFDPTSGNLVCLNHAGATTACSSGGGFTAGGDLSGTSTSQQVIGIDSVPLCTGFTPTNGQVLQYTTGSSPNPCYTAVSGGGSVSNQVEGQDPTTTSSATALNFSSPSEVKVSAYCGSTTSCNPGGGITDECHAIRAIVTAYNCLAANNASCNIMDDMTGTQYCSEEPLPNSFSGRLDFKTNGAAHELMLDGISTLTLPGATQVHGMGTTGTDQIGENTTVAMCNPLTDNCPNGGFQIQNSSATTLGLSASGSVTTVTFTASVNFTTTSTALNQLTAGRKLCIAGATGTIWNGCFVIASVTGSSGAVTAVTLDTDSTTQTGTCAAPCGSAVAYLNTHAVAIGYGGGGGVYGTRIGDIIIDCHIMIGGAGLVNAQGEEGTGTDGALQIYNCPDTGLTIQQDGTYGGNGTTGSVDSGPYGAIAVNFNPYPVTLVGGANCSNSGVGSCVGGNVAVGNMITCGAGSTSFAVLTPNPCVNPNWVGVSFLSQANGNQGFGDILRLTVSCSDKTSSGNCIFTASGASQPTGIVFIGIHGAIDDSHTEFVRNAADVCGDPAINASLAEFYGTTSITTGVTLKGGFWSWNNGIGLDIGQSGQGAWCSDITAIGVNMLNGGSGKTLIQDNITGRTITSSASEQVETYLLGHGTPPSVYSSSPSVSMGMSSLTVGTTSPATTPAGVVNATVGFEISGAAASGAVLTGNGTNFISALPGVSVNAQTGTTYTYSTSTDRAAYTSFSNAGAIAVTLPSAASLGNNWVNVSCDIGAGTATITPTTSTISYTNGSTYTSAATTLALSTGQCAWIYSNNTNYFAILRTGGTSLPESGLTGATAATTITESGATSSVTRAGVATANLTAPWVFQNTNSTNNNTSIGLGVTTPGTSTGQTTLNINGASTGGDLLDAGTGGTWTAGVLSGQTILAKLGINGGWTGLNFTSNGTTAGFFDFPQGSTSASVAPCNTANSKCFQAPTALTANVETLAPATAQGVFAVTGTASATNEMYSGDANHSATVSWSTATSVGSTSLCSTTFCPVGTYKVNVYIDVTTACTTTGSYVVNLIWTDDTTVSKTSVIPLVGLGVTPTFGPTAITATLVPTSTTDFGTGSMVIRSTGTTSINYSTTAGACGTGGPGVGKLYFSVEPVQ
jgi:hypothetical protein